MQYFMGRQLMGDAALNKASAVDGERCFLKRRIGVTWNRTKEDMTMETKRGRLKIPFEKIKYPGCSGQHVLPLKPTSGGRRLSPRFAHLKRCGKVRRAARACGGRKKKIKATGNSHESLEERMHKAHRAWLQSQKQRCTVEGWTKSAAFSSCGDGGVSRR